MTQNISRCVVNAASDAYLRDTFVRCARARYGQFGLEKRHSRHALCFYLLFLPKKRHPSVMVASFPNTFATSLGFIGGHSLSGKESPTSVARDF